MGGVIFAFSVSLQNYAQDINTMLIYNNDNSINAYPISQIDSIGFAEASSGWNYQYRRLPYLLSPMSGEDMTDTIQHSLDNYGICLLEAGEYNISSRGIKMPEGSCLKGMGNRTKIILRGNADYEEGYCIRLSSYCSVSDLSFQGWNGKIQISDAIQNRHAILWSGEDGNVPERGAITNCYFEHFKGAAICAKETGTPIQKCLNVSDCYIDNCRAGIFIAQHSEYHRFTNIHIQGCYYGCVNNGGNNMFSNCSFTGNKIGFVIDGSDSSKTNLAHGSVVGCTFNHSGSNTGIGIKITNITHGFIFSGCQIFYSKIELKDAQGVVFSNCNFGRNEGILVNGGGALLFDGCMFGTSPLLEKNDNELVRFSNCYVRSNGEEVK